MAQITAYNKIINGTRGDATKLNFNFTTIEEKYNEHDTATSNIHDLGTETIAGQVGLQTLIDRFNPVSTVIHIWRPTGVNCDAVDSDIYLPLDGGTVDDTDSLYDEVVLPDMDNKYLISVETSGTVDATPIGNSGHTIDFSHYHTAIAHQHSSSNHNHDIGVHEHTIVGSVDFGIQEKYIGYNITRVNFKSNNTTIPINGIGFSMTNYVTYSELSSGVEEQKPSVYGSASLYTQNNLTYNSAGAITGNTNPANANSSTNDTSTVGSATQDIQPKSLQVQMYIRYK